VANEEALLRAILSAVARRTFRVADILALVAIGAGKDKQIAAYNLCDGTRTQGEIAKALALDPGNFSRTVGRWIDEGIVIKVGDGRDVKLQHVYPLPRDALKRAEKSIA
jgi:hypothetical protein